MLEAFIYISLLVYIPGIHDNIFNEIMIILAPIRGIKGILLVLHKNSCDKLSLTLNIPSLIHQRSIPSGVSKRPHL